MNQEDKHTFLKAAHAAGITSGGHAIFFLELECAIGENYLETIAASEEAKLALTSVFILTSEPGTPQHVNISSWKNKIHPEVCMHVVS